MSTSTSTALMAPRPRASEQQQLSVPPAASTPFVYNQMMMLAKACAMSGFYKDVSRDANKAVVKMMIGHELGIGPGASLSGIYVVQDKIVLSANLIAGLIKRSGRYDYKVLRLDDEGCILEFFSIDPQTGKRESLGKSEFLKAHAEKAGALNKPGPWKVYPRNMYFSRALTNGQKWHCPDLTAGAPVYTPDELGLEEDEDGALKQEAVMSTTTPALTEKLRELIQKTETPASRILDYYAATSLEGLGDENTRSAITKLEQKLAMLKTLSPSASSSSITNPSADTSVVEPESTTPTVV